MMPPQTAQDPALVRIVLCTTTHPGNIGAAARAMKTMGMRELALVTPRHFPSEEATVRAVSAADLLERATVHDSLDQALAGCRYIVGMTARRRDLSHDMVSLREAALRAAAELGSVSVRQRAPSVSPQGSQGGRPEEGQRASPEEGQRASVAFVFGTEMSGLSNAELERCSLLANIPTDPDFGSLNLGSAVQLACYELRMAILGDQPLRAYPQAMAEHLAVEGLFQHIEQVLHLTGFLRPDRPKRLMERLRRLLVRARLEHEEVSLLRGLLRSFERSARPATVALARRAKRQREASAGHTQDHDSPPRSGG